MSIKRITALIAGSSAVASAVASVTIASASAEAAACIDAWNNKSNSAAQQNLAEFFADGGAGNIIVGLDDGNCLLAAHNILKPTYAAYGQADHEFEPVNGGPGDQFWQDVATVGPVNVVLADAGKVEPVSQ
jgi:hypothetical protein